MKLSAARPNAGPERVLRFSVDVPVVLVDDTDAQSFLYRFPGRTSIRLISNEASTSNQAAPPAGRRPCPFCGTWNATEFSFCQRCGRQLPTQETPGSQVVPISTAQVATFPSTSAAFGSASISSSASPDAPIAERPLTSREVDLLHRSEKTGVIPLLRILGVLTGIMPLSLIAAAVAGAPLVADIYTPLILITGFLGIGFGGASRSRRTAIARALANGSGRELYGIPEMQAAKAGSVAVGLGGLSLRLKAAQAARLLPDRMNKIVYVDSGAAGGPRAEAGWSVALAMEWNGTEITKPETFLVKTGAAGVGK